MEYNLDFISKEDFEKHVTETLKQCSRSLKSIDLKTFNNTPSLIDDSNIMICIFG